MTCSIILTAESISDYLVWPTGCDYYFYLKILGALFMVISWTIYKAEKQTQSGGADLLSAMGVSSIAITIIAVIGTLITNTQNIAMIQGDILLYILAVSIPILLIWFFKD